MLKYFFYLFKYYIFWIIFFFILRIVFLVYYYSISFPLIYLWDDILWHSLRLDLSASGYIMLLPSLVVLISVFIPGRWAHINIKIYTIILSALITLIAVVDLISYADWGFRMDATPLFYLSKPRAAAASASVVSIILHTFLAIAIFSSILFIFRRLFKNDFALEQKRHPWASIPILILTGSLFIPIRGSLGTAPINIGSAYFSDIAFVNHASINLPWNIIYSLTNLETVSNPYTFMDREKALELSSNFTSSDTASFRLLKNSRPNIILIILESYTANVIGSLNGLVNVSPEIDTIAKDGILFTQCYSSGNRTDKGMVAILSGYPSQPTTSIIKFPNKTQSLPALPRKLRDVGYSSSFYYGGDIEFANYQSYIINAGYKSIISLNDFPENQRICSWGVPDEFLFERAFHDLKSAEEPYLFTLFTLSSHPPYDVPMETVIEGNDPESKFCNSAYYTDRSLGQFIDNLKRENMLENTLIVITADHGSTWPGNYGNTAPEKYHIPLIFYGGALSVSDTIIPTIVNQTDIAPTLLHQMNIDSKEFSFSKNMLSVNTPVKTLYMFNNGFGYISDSLKFYYERDPNKTKVLTGKMKESSLNEGKAYLQILYDDLLDR